MRGTHSYIIELLEEQTGAEEQLPGVESAAVVLNGRSVEGVDTGGIGLADLEDVLGTDLLGKPPVGVEQVGYVVEVGADLEGRGLACDVDDEVLCDLEVDAVLPRSNLSAALAVLAAV